MCYALDVLIQCVKKTGVVSMGIIGAICARESISISDRAHQDPPGTPKFETLPPSKHRGPSPAHALIDAFNVLFNAVLLLGPKYISTFPTNLPPIRDGE